MVEIGLKIVDDKNGSGLEAQRTVPHVPILCTKPLFKTFDNF